METTLATTLPEPQPVRIEWAYPSSPDAVRFKKVKQGCFIIEYSHTCKLIDGGFATRKEAVEYCRENGLNLIN